MQQSGIRVEKYSKERKVFIADLGNLDRIINLNLQVTVCLCKLFSTLVDSKMCAGSVNPIMTDGNLAVEDVNLSMRDGNLPVEVSNQLMVAEDKHSTGEPAYHNPHYCEAQNLMKENLAQQYEEVKVDESDVDTKSSNYQSLSMTTMDYVSVYSVPGKGKEGDIIPKVKVEGKFYAVVNKDKTEQHVYTSLAK